jgi:hypothetical protein
MSRSNRNHRPASTSPEPVRDAVVVSDPLPTDDSEGDIEIICVHALKNDGRYSEPGSRLTLNAGIARRLKVVGAVRFF